MPEPNATAAAAATGGMAATITGSVLGLAYDALLGGLLGGLLSLMYLAPMPVPRMAASLAGAALAGGAFGPVALAAGAHYLPWLAGVGAGPLRMAAAIAVGLVAQVAIPAGLEFVRRRAQAAQETRP